MLNRNAKTLRCIRAIANWLSNAFDSDDGCGFAYDLDKRGAKINYSLVTLNNTIAPPLAQAAKLLNDPKLAEIANRAMATVLLRRPAIDGKFFAEYQVFLAEYLDTVDKNTPLSRHLLLDRVFGSPGYAWRIRVNFPTRFIYRLTANEAKIKMQRWVKGSYVKKELETFPTDYTLKQGDKVVDQGKFDPKNEDQIFTFNLKGNPGDEFILDIRDISCGDWGIAAITGAVAGSEGDSKGRISLARNGMRKFYFEVPAEGEVKFRYYGTHIGPWAITVYDENDKVIFEQEDTTLHYSMRREANKHADVTIKGNGKNGSVP